MILKSSKCRLSVVNLFADFILSKIPAVENSIIQVIDCVNFFVIKGKTSYKDILDMGTLINEFKSSLPSEFDEVITRQKLTHTIDLLEYNIKMEPVKKITQIYHNTENCIYHQEQIEKYKQNPNLSYKYNFLLKEINDESYLSVISDFPHGYSLSQGRELYYYGKHIIYNIPTTFPFNTLSLTLHYEGENKIEIYNPETKEKETELESAIMDMFDFDMSEINGQIKKVDWKFEITNPLDEYDFLKKKVKDFFFI